MPNKLIHLMLHVPDWSERRVAYILVEDGKLNPEDEMSTHRGIGRPLPFLLGEDGMVYGQKIVPLGHRPESQPIAKLNEVRLVADDRIEVFTMDPQLDETLPSVIRNLYIAAYQSGFEDARRKALALKQAYDDFLTPKK